MNLKAQANELNRMILKGQILDAFETFYDEDVVVQENDGTPRIGKQTNRQHQEDFVRNVSEWRGAEVRAMAVDEQQEVVFTEWFLDFTTADTGEVSRSQVVVQRWRDGKVVNERLYYVEGS